MSREKRLDYIKRMSDKDLERFDDCVDFICSLCSPTETMCENCELCALMSDVDFEFEECRKEKR